MKRLILLSILAFTLVFSTTAYAEKYGVYVKAVEKIEGTFDNAVKAVEDSLKQSGWQVLASHEAQVPEGCGFRAHSIVIHSPEYAQNIISKGQRAAFALPLRVSIYEDEKGMHAAFVNPASINRTILGDDVLTKLSVKTMNEISGILAGAVKGNVVNKQIGEIREKGRIGGIGGGNFNDKIEEIFKKEETGTVFQDMTQKVKDGITSNKDGWKLEYSLSLDEGKIVVYGVNKGETEARAYGIAGEKRESDDYKCPGIDHAAAFPIEIVMYSEKGMAKVLLLDEMYRMKLYFEDAGNWAFMKNMRMPGQIEDEIVQMSLSQLKQ